MPLSKKQKKYIKKHRRQKSVKQLAEELGVDIGTIRRYWQKHQSKKIFFPEISESKKNHPLSVKPTIKRLSLKKILQNNRRFLILIILLSTLAYANALPAKFVSDDIAGVLTNPNLNSFSYFIIPPYIQFNLWLFLGFLANKIFGPNPFFYHLINLVFHGGAAVVVFLLANLWLSPAGSLAAGTLFAVHPILTESVTWVSGGGYSAGGFFLLASLFIYLWRGRSEKKSLWISFFLFYLALSVNEKMIVLPIIIGAYEIANQSLKKQFKRLIPFFCLAAVWTIFLLGLLGKRAASLATDFQSTPTFFNPLIQIPIAVSSYLQLIFYPRNLAFYHSELSFTLQGYIIKVLILLIFLAAIAVSYKKNRLISFWLLFFLISLSPTLLPISIAWIVAERYAYLGTAGIVIAFAIATEGFFRRSIKKPSFFYVFIFLAAAILLGRTILRNRDWRDQDSLWLATAKTSPSSYQNHNNLGDLYGRRGQLDKSVEEFKTAIKLKPNYADAYHNLGNTYRQMNKPDLAIKSYQKAAELNPRLWQSYQNLGGIYFNQKKYDLAEKMMEKAAAANPANPNILVNLGIIRLRLNEPQKAKEALRKALKIDPKNQKARQILFSLKNVPQDGEKSDNGAKTKNN